MVHEILFRGKRMDNGEWVYGDYHKFTCTTSGIIPTPTHYIMGTDVNFRGQIWVDPDTVGQYTGLDDKNGVKIFEGDIVHIHDLIFKYGDPHHEFNGYVDFANGSFVILGINEVVHYRWLDYDITVIGNIYDDPEILGGNDGTAD